MNLVLIYGPPGVGKLTVAKELAALTGYKLFHNHLTLNYVAEIFDWKGPTWDLVPKIRFLMIDAAAREGISLILTCVYPIEEDDEQIDQMYVSVEGQGGSMRLVQLACRQDVLEQRVQAEGRAELQKLTSVESLRGVIERYPRMLGPVAGRDSLVLDNTDLSPEVAAEQIVAHFDLLAVES